LYKAEDTVSAVFSFESGVVGTGSWSFVVSPEAEEDIIEITGTKGKVSLATFLLGDVRLVTSQANSNFSFHNPENISHNLIRQVVGNLRCEAKCVSTGISGARTNWVLGEITKNYYG